jgi:hypothetical protein
MGRYASMSGGFESRKWWPSTLHTSLPRLQLVRQFGGWRERQPAATWREDVSLLGRLYRASSCRQYSDADFPMRDWMLNRSCENRQGDERLLHAAEDRGTPHTQGWQHARKHGAHWCTSQPCGTRFCQRLLQAGGWCIPTSVCQGWILSILGPGVQVSILP